MPNITKIKTNHAITYTNTDLFLGWNKVNHLWNKHKHCSQRKIEGALLFSSVIHGSAELFARGKNWNGVIVAQFVFLFLARATFRETSKKMDIKNCQFHCKKKTNRNKTRTTFHRNDIKMFKTLQWNFSSRLVAPLAFWTPWRHSHDR